LVRFGFQGSSVEGFEFLADVASKIVRLGHAVIIAEIWTLELLRCERCEDFEVHRRFFDVCGCLWVRRMAMLQLLFYRVCQTVAWKRCSQH
jgi:hypothetical protein